MTMKTFALFALLTAAILAAPNTAYTAVTGSAYPSYVLKNQFGETSINSSIYGGTVFDCLFTVASTDAAGAGITSLNGPACASVFMHTTQTPAVGSPNPAVGYIVVNLKSQYFAFNSFSMSTRSSPALPPINVTTGVTAGSPYAISSLGTTTAAGWLNLGLPAGVTPVVGAAFIAPSTTVSTGTGTIEAPGTVAGNAVSIDRFGIASAGLSATPGGQIILRVAAPTSSSVTTLIPTAPIDGTVIELHFVLRPLSSQLK